MENENIKEFDRIILGIDPGTIVMGYGIIGINKKQVSLINNNSTCQYFKFITQLFSRDVAV